MCLNKTKITPVKEIREPQHTSTPTHAMPVKDSLNETIIAESIESANTVWKDVVPEETEKKGNDITLKEKKKAEIRREKNIN